MHRYTKNAKDERFRQIVAPAMTPQTAEPAAAPTFLGKILSRALRLASFFKTKEEPVLIGRIHELDANADEYYGQLIAIRDEFSKDSDPETYTFVEAIIEPLLREMPRIHSNLHSRTATQQAKTFKDYNDWIDRVKIWIHFYHRAHTRQQIIDAVVEQLVGTTLKMIDRDIALIYSYRNHQLFTLSYDEERLNQIAKELDHLLNPHIEQLSALRHRPAVISLVELSNWKQQIDTYRQSSYEGALHVIDAIVERESPSQLSFESVEHMHEVVSEVAYLENETLDLLENSHHSSRRDIKILISHLMALEEATERLQQDQNIGWALLHRLQMVTQNLKKARMNLDHSR